MKDRIAEVIERNVAFNPAELSFLESLERNARNEMPANYVRDATGHLINRVLSKLEKAQNYRPRRRR